MRERDDDALVGDKILDRHVAFVRHEVRAAWGGVLVLDGRQLVLDDGEHAFLAGEDVHQVLNFDE